MAGMTVRIREETHEALRQLAEREGDTLQDVLSRAVEAYRRAHILAESNVGYAALRADPVAWQEELEERGAWEVTLADGLADE